MKKTLQGLIVGTAAMAVLSGCDTLDPGAGYGAAGYLAANQGPMLASNRTGVLGWGLLGGLLSGQGEYERQSAVANNAVDRLQQQQSQQQNPVVNYDGVSGLGMGRTPFSCLYSSWIDSNGNKTIEPNELEGRTFRASLSQQNSVKFSTEIKGYNGGQRAFYLYRTDDLSAAKYITDWKEIPYESAWINEEIATSTLRDIGLTGKVLVDVRAKKSPSDDFHGQLVDKYVVYLGE